MHYEDNFIRIVIFILYHEFIDPWNCYLYLAIRQEPM